MLTFGGACQHSTKMASSFVWAIPLEASAKFAALRGADLLSMFELCIGIVSYLFMLQAYMKRINQALHPIMLGEKMYAVVRKISKAHDGMGIK